MGQEQGVLETPEHLLSECDVYADLRAVMNVEVVLEDRASCLRKAIKRRKELEVRVPIRDCDAPLEGECYHSMLKKGDSNQD